MLLSIYKFQRGVQLNKYQKLALLFTFVFVCTTVFLFNPIKEVFAGNIILKQGFSWKFFEPDNISQSSYNLFNGVIFIRFYAICIWLGLIAGYSLALNIAQHRHIATSVIDRLVVGLVVFGLIGARLFFVLFNLDLFLPVNRNENLFQVFAQYDFWESVLFIQQGGLAFFGMLFACTLYLYLYCKKYKFSFFEFLDILTPSLLIGQIIGRFGNFFNYESYGGPTSVFWKMFVPDNVNFYETINQKFFHPTFLYEIIPNTVLFLILLWSYASLTKKQSGLVFSYYAIGYGIIRFFTEFFRLDALIVSLPEVLHITILGMVIDTIRVSQFTSFGLILIGLTLLKSRLIARF